MSSHIKQILTIGPVIPVLTIDSLECAVPLARALVGVGLRVLEITLRTPVAFDAIETIAQEVDGAIVGVGTVITPFDMDRAAKAGAVFAVSPGLTDGLANAAQAYLSDMPLLPGIASASEVMRAQEAGFECLKLFPAEAVGGTRFLKFLAGPFPQVTFCPTGGVSPNSAPDYLDLPNVACVGGSWVTPRHAVNTKNWGLIKTLAQTASKLRPRSACTQAVYSNMETTQGSGRCNET